MLFRQKLLAYKLTGFHIPNFGANIKNIYILGKKHPVVNKDLKPGQKQQKMLEIGLVKHRLL